MEKSKKDEISKYNTWEDWWSSLKPPSHVKQAHFRHRVAEPPARRDRRQKKNII